jgi:hypothetical protein
MTAKGKRQTSEAGVPEGAMTLSTGLRSEARTSAVASDSDRTFERQMEVARRIMGENRAVLKELAK